MKITRMSAWATRVGVTKLGIGEYNGLDAASIQPPAGGRAPGWRAGLVVARRQAARAAR